MKINDLDRLDEILDNMPDVKEKIDGQPKTVTLEEAKKQVEMFRKANHWSYEH